MSEIAFDNYVLSKIGIDLFARPSGCRTFSAQTIVAVKPGASA